MSDTVGNQIFFDKLLSSNRITYEKEKKKKERNLVSSKTYRNEKIPISEAKLNFFY